ncbi:MAG TPA: hypothetical protein VD838_22570 [Anaeromyxobacteraceae bacterium]|nr:hypothetical protein [Anaeromyxobacteraceae bacterium]
MKRIRESAYRAFRIDAPLPPSGPKRYLLIAWLVLGALVALFVPIVLAVLIWGIVTGQDRPAPERAPAPPPVSDGAR